MKKKQRRAIKKLLELIWEVDKYNESKPEFFVKNPKNPKNKNPSDYPSDYEHFVVCINTNDDNLTCMFFTNSGFVCIDNAYTYDLYPGKNIDLDSYEIVGTVEWSEKGIERIKEIEEGRKNGLIEQLD